MGSWDFFIDLKINSDTANTLLQEYKNNDLYQSIFHYGIVVEWLNSDFNAGISSKIDNFLPANTLIFKFFSTIQENKDNLYIRTRGVERFFDFKRKSDFINFMYNTWEESIDSTYNQEGVIIINQKNYYRTRNKLYKRYYKKL